MSRAFVDSFSGAVAELTRKQQADPVAVLRALQRSPMVSTWDLSGSLDGVIWQLKKDGLIEDQSMAVGYPSHKFVVTPKGAERLAAMARSGLSRLCR